MISRARDITFYIFDDPVIEEINMSIELKIKIKNLADEARTIRKEEQKLHGMEKWKLQHHRKTVVRNAARRTLIAYQILRGREWTQHALQAPNYDVRVIADHKEIQRMLKKYGDIDLSDNLSAA